MIKLIPMDQSRISEMVQLWNKEIEKDFPLRERLLQQNIFEDKNLLTDGSWFAIDELTDAIIGFVVAKAWKDDVPGIEFNREAGWIQTILVDSNYRSRGIGSKLLSKAEEALYHHGVNRISIGDDLYRRIFPGIPDNFSSVKQWFEKKGYDNKGLTHDMTSQYDDHSPLSPPEFQGVSFTLAQPQDRDRVINFMKRCFPGTWEYQTIQYWEAGGTGREFILLEKDGKIGGFCRINDSHSPLLAQNIYWSPLFQDELGGIGPLGIDEDLRGLRYGLGIVEAGIYYLRRRGVRHIVIDTTPFIDFYGKLGYKIWKSYCRYVK